MLEEKPWREYIALIQDEWSTVYGIKIKGAYTYIEYISLMLCPSCEYMRVTDREDYLCISCRGKAL